MKLENPNQYPLNVNGFDYTHQAWVVNGLYESCGHDQTKVSCHCFGRIHAGERFAPDAEIH